MIIKIDADKMPRKIIRQALLLSSSTHAGRVRLSRGMHDRQYFYADAERADTGMAVVQFLHRCSVEYVIEGPIPKGHKTELLRGKPFYRSFDALHEAYEQWRNSQ